MRANHSALAIGLMATFGLALPQHASAASITWTGLNGFWENGANWSGASAPTAADQATTAAGVVISSEAVNSAQELFNNAKLNVAKNSLTIGGTIENNKNNSDASLMTSLGGTAQANRILNYGGVVVSDGLGSTLTSGAGGFFNYANGRVRASNSGVLNADSFDNFSLLDAITSGDVNLNTLFNRTGATAEAQGAGSTITVTGAVSNEVGAALVASVDGKLTAGGVGNAGQVLALSGGDIELNSLTNNTGGSTEAQGTGSSIAVLGAATNAAGATIAASEGASISAGSISNSGEVLALTGGGITTNSLANNAGARSEAQGSGSTITVNTSVTNAVGGTVASTASAKLTAGSIDNSGRVLALGGGDIQTNTLSNKVGAETQVDGIGSQIIVTGAATNSGLVAISNSGELAAESFAQDAGVTRLVNGTLTVTDVAQVNGGRLEGEGFVIGDTFVNEGAVIAPGLSNGDAGQLSIDGQFNLDGLALFEIGGLTNAFYDVIKISGLTTFGATSSLQVALFNAFAPSLGNKFDILVGGTFGGLFGSSALPGLGGGLSWQINYLADRVQLEVVAATTAVPLPASVWLMLSALMGVASMRRRRA